MKVLLFNGSTKENGCVFTALSEIATVLNQEGIETEILQMGSSPVYDCMGCDFCHNAGGGYCIFDDDMVNEWLDKVKTADGFIFGSPVFYAHPTGQLQAILDRLFYAGGEYFMYKPGAAIVTARRAGTTASLDVLNKYFTDACMPVISLSFDVANLYVQVCKLIIDLQVIFRHFPWWSIVTVCWLFFNRWRKKIALNRLRHFEARNCGFINELPIVSMSCGSMGKRKTTLITDMVLSQEVMFRQKALSILQQNDMKFPNFPWIKFEDELRACMEHGTVYNLASVKTWVALKRQRFARHHNVHWQIYGYELQRYGGTFDDSLKVNGLFDILETYAQAYFIYVIQSSLIVANYSIRTDNALMNNGNFPLWLTDFFPKHRRECNRHAHILDFDVLRLGKKVLENNPKAGSFEFGVVAITEIGKERGNNLELKEVKKGTDEANQKNDLFNSWLKMCRHSATVDNFPFIKVFTDEQRPESWGADARDLCDVIHIVSSGEQRLALPLYTIEEMISEWAFNRFMRLYEDFRFRRGDNTLLVHIRKSITAWLWHRNLRVYNRFGYSILKIEKERGTMDGKTENKKYYLMNAKIYAKRFSTDCFSDYFNDMAKKSKTGLMDYIEYVTEKATVDELKMQNSYFINSLYGNAGNGSA